MTEAKMLLINDDEIMARYLREQLIVNGGYSVFWESDAHAGLGTFKESTFDIVVIGLNISNSDALDFIKIIKKADPYCLIIVIIEENNFELQRQIFVLGVYEVLTKPINLDKLFFLVKKGVELHSFTSSHRKLSAGLQEQNVSLQKQNILLARRIEESTKNLTRLYEDLRSTYMQTIKVLAHTIDAKDHYTHSHSENVAKYAVAIAEEMGLSSQDIQIIRDACELHDLGKIGVEDSILSKPSGLTSEEREQIKKHPQIAAKILEPLNFLNGVVELVRQHHEHFDGSGYPDGKRGEAILLGARIINLADAYDAMRSARSYRKIPLSKEETIAEIKKNIGLQFDPTVVNAFLKIVDKLEGQG